MANLPVIVGFGGLNAAGRSSSHHAYRRMIIESLETAERQETLAGLAVMMGLLVWRDGAYHDADNRVHDLDSIESNFGETILSSTLIRRIDPDYFDVDNVIDFGEIELKNSTASHFELPKRKLPAKIPDNWSLEMVGEKRVKVTVNDSLLAKVETSRKTDVQSAGQLPSGFQVGELYNSRYHPRGLQMTVVSASDAINSIGIPWEDIINAIAPDELAIYASSTLSQMDDNSYAGVLQSRLKAKRVSSKQLALGFNTMPADFVNAYICGSVGGTGSMTGACASFLYNLRVAVNEIRQGTRRVVIVGGSEAPITSEIIEGFDAMGAVARAEQLKKLDDDIAADLRRSSRPFGENCGFTIAESAQYVVLMDDALAIELGAEIHGAVNDVFVNADGYKKSISSPGPGNYVTMSKAVASAVAILGEEAVQQHSFVQAHGSSTPQNRVTESVILDKVAQAFDITNWPVTAVKAYIGHSLGSASGDQLINTLGVFKYGYLPGIKTIDSVADDVVGERLNIPLKDLAVPQAQVAFLNSKGFGGNNATASVLSPSAVMTMLKKRYSSAELADYQTRLRETQQGAADYDAAFCQGDYRTIYRFGENLIDESAIAINKDELLMPGYKQAVRFTVDNPYADMCE